MSCPAINKKEIKRRGIGVKNRDTLALSDGSRSTDYSSSKKENPAKKQAKGTNPSAILSEERDFAMGRAFFDPDSPLRAIAREMIDEGIVCLSPSIVHMILREVDLIGKRE